MSLLKKLMVLAALASLMCSCGIHRELSMATYNVGAFNKFEETSIKAVADSIWNMDIEVIGLQELDSCVRRTGKEYQLKLLASQMRKRPGSSRKTGETKAAAARRWNYRFAKAISFQGGSYGIGIMTSPKEKIIGDYSINLPKGNGTEVRALLAVETKDYVFATTHLDYKSQKTQLNQAKIVTEELKSRYKKGRKPVFLCGDMNSYPDSKVMDYYRKHWVVLSPEGITFPHSDGTGVCLDYIMVLKGRPKVTVLESGIHSANQQSDHYPVVLKVKY